MVPEGVARVPHSVRTAQAIRQAVERVGSDTEEPGVSRVKRPMQTSRSVSPGVLKASPSSTTVAYRRPTAASFFEAARRNRDLRNRLPGALTGSDRQPTAVRVKQEPREAPVDILEVPASCSTTTQPTEQEVPQHQITEPLVTTASLPATTRQPTATSRMAIKSKLVRRAHTPLPNPAIVLTETHCITLISPPLHLLSIRLWTLDLPEASHLAPALSIVRVNVTRLRRSLTSV